MRRTVFLCVIVAALVGCGSSQNAVEKQTKERKLEAQVADSVNGRCFTVIFDYVQPRNMISAHYLTSTYYVKLKDDSVRSELPYFGRAYRADISHPGRSPLSFVSAVQNVTVKQGRKKDYVIYLKLRNGSEWFDYYLNVFPNGKSTLNVSSSDRESISFTGQMEMNQ